MSPFPTSAGEEITSTGVARLGMTHIEPFNGCHEMRLMKGSDRDDDAMVAGSHRVIVTARFATDSVWSKTVVVNTV
jgi:hypothetical protein